MGSLSAKVAGQGENCAEHFTIALVLTSLAKRRDVEDIRIKFDGRPTVV